MLIDQKINSQTNDSELFMEGVMCINSAQWLLAYGIFKQLISAVKNPSGAMLYNMALCHFFAEEYVKTIVMLNEALQKTAKPSSLANQASNFPEQLWVVEHQTNAHLFALTETIFSINPAIVKLRIRRLLIDANVKIENWQEVIRLASLPEMEKCTNVIEAVAIAKKQY
ncbi:hypothetical protein EZJ43_07855 [Pedobacter changchengzhani]|uniref:Tetratricopeptide repeat protein n=1 Tax=Pedobacter changchengzhani TaxID=2529274 RepID=A0A4R5ML60_9SPHI|nr:hypothetical protein [Pedobacter changchengzhani]TDG36424.1 hypothetical protein EZJ43_07855 [Pedobacter changchengzhani]